jgi:transcriptional regulator GlxA family with amidase domain
VSAKQYVLRVRLDEATRLLGTTDLPIAEIATRCGFYDQAALTRRFSRAVGMSPRRYRDLHRA